MLIVAGMGFDAPNSGSWTWLFLLIVLVIPFSVFLGPSVARKALSRGKVKMAFTIVILPQALILAPMLLALLWSMLYALFATGGLWKL